MVAQIINPELDGTSIEEQVDTWSCLTEICSGCVKTARMMILEDDSNFTKQMIQDLKEDVFSFLNDEKNH